MYHPATFDFAHQSLVVSLSVIIEGDDRDTTVQRTSRRNELVAYVVNRKVFLAESVRGECQCARCRARLASVDGRFGEIDASFAED